jgi:hypothetical protein
MTKIEENDTLLIKIQKVYEPEEIKNEKNKQDLD